MDIRTLRLFMKVVERGNISAAAEELGMAQPVLSRHIRNLENEMSTKLLDRHPRGVSPNASGQVLVDATRSIEANFRSALRHISEAQEDSLGHARVGATSSWLQQRFPPAVAKVVAAHRSASVSVVKAPADRLLNDLLRGRFDFVLAPIDTTRSFAGLLQHRVLYHARFEVFSAGDHPAHSAGPLALQDLMQWEWALPRQSHARRIFSDIHIANGLQPPEASIEVDDAEMIYDIVEGSDLLSYGMLPAREARLDSGLSSIDCPQISQSCAQCAVWLQAGKLNSVSRFLINELAKDGGQNSAGQGGPDQWT